MGLVIPKPILRWNEPRDYRRSIPKTSQSKKFSYFVRAGIFLSSIGFCILAWLIANPKTRASFQSMLLDGICLGFFLNFYLWISSFGKTSISFMENAVVYRKVSSVIGWKYSDISGWKIEEKILQDKKFRIFLFKYLNGRIWSFAIADTIKREQIAAVMKSKNVQELNSI